MTFDVNLLAVLVAIVIQQALGALWYGVIFRDEWMRRMGKTQADVGTGGFDATQIVSFITSIVMALGLAVVIASLDEDPSAILGLTAGLLAGVGFVAASTLMNAAYEQRDNAVTWMFVSYMVLSLGAMGALLGAWQ